MRQRLCRFAPVALASCAAVTLLTGADTAKPATEWVAKPAEAARVAKVEASLAPVTLPGQPPQRLSLKQWMELYKIPGLSVAVFDKNGIVWANDKAIAAFKQSLKLDPENTNAKQLLEKLGAKP